MERKEELTRVLAAGLALAVTLAAAPLAAAPDEPAAPEPASPAATPPTAPPSAGAEGIDEAKERYIRALELVQEGAYDAAMLEFKKAYALAPSYKILYNMAVVAQRLNDFAQAYRLFNRYLHEGGTEVPNERRDYVQRQLKYLTGRVARIRVLVDVQGAEVAVDDAIVAQSSSKEALLVNAGRRKVSVSAPGRVPVARVVELAGGEATVIEISLLVPQAAPERRPLTPDARPSQDQGLPTWPFWAVTAAAGGLAGAYTIKAYSSQGDLSDARDRYGVTRSELDELQERARRDALIADVLWAGTAVAAGLALVVTLTGGPETKEEKGKAKISLGLAPSGPGAGIFGQF